MTPEECPNCGADVPPRAKACPACGADERTGWSDDAYADRLGIPDESFDYDKFVREEFGGRKPQRKRNWIWVVVAIILLLAILGVLR